MNLKKTILTFAMMTFMVFAISTVTDATYAYWASNITPPPNTDTNGTIDVGTWAFAPQYDPNTSYNIGDRVTNNGIIYEAKKSGLLREPGVEAGWARDWTQIT